MENVPILKFTFMKKEEVQSAGEPRILRRGVIRGAADLGPFRYRQQWISIGA